jgi:hypothetical protein
MMQTRDGKYGTRHGLEGPYEYPNGRVLYFDAAEGDYWDPRTDFYVTRDEVIALQKSILDILVR